MPTMHVSKSIHISKPSAEIFAYVRLLKNQDHYSVWNQRDPERQVEYHGEDGTTGFRYSWDSQDKNVGAGTQTITHIVENQRIEMQLAFHRPMKSTGNAIIELRELDTQKTAVTWSFESPISFPFSLLKGFFEKTVSKDLQQNLDNLKAVLEN